ncbi:MAG: nucleoside hydrolase [Pseudomonadota bacterium]
MAAHSIILDCDPGQDDAVNLLLALSSPDEIEVRGVTTVAGNVPLALTERNARIVCDLAGRTDTAVYAGCSRPMVRDLFTAEYVHGNTGIDGTSIFDPQTPLQGAHAVDFIVDTLRAAEPDSVTLVPTGPLTNIALALVKDPTIVDSIKRIVLMGGAMREGGNHTPAAEFNILVDPHAAHVVLRCGRPIVMMGLDVTHQVLVTQTHIDAIQALGSRAAVATAGMLGFYTRYDTSKYQSDGGPLHDPCTTAWLLEPALFTGRECHVAVETASELTMGCTAVDFWGVTGREPNVTWMHRVDADGFFELLLERLRRFG